MTGDKQILLELVECLSSTVSECSRSIEAIRYEADTREKALLTQIEMLSARLYKQEKLAAEICEELGDSEQRLRDLLDRKIKITKEEIEDRYQTESLKLLEVTHNTFGAEIDKLREAVYETKITPKKEAEAYVELADRCSRMLQATRNAQERLKSLSVASPQRSRNI
jgi:uncharacterized protein YbcC (UPF0753/DUF2309 family)